MSKKFAMLRQASPYTSAEEQPCWVLTSAPALTLALPGLTEMSPEMLAMTQPDAEPMAPCEHLAMVVGGTGIAPALQIMREVGDGEGAFGPGCEGTLLYSSRTPQDVLCIGDTPTAPCPLRVAHNFTPRPRQMSCGRWRRAPRAGSPCGTR